MAPPDRWYQHVPAATAVISCEGEAHRLTWRWGKFKLDDHDLGSERAMLVLGGEPCPCLRALGLWANLFDMRPDQLGQMRKHMGEEAALIPHEFDVARDVGLILNLERAWKKSRYLDKQGRMLERQVKDRALPAFRAALNAEKQRFGTRLIRTALVKHVAAVHPVRVEGRMDSVSVSATVTLSSTWVVNVWAKGLAVVDGTFVVDAAGPAGPDGSLTVRAIQWEAHPSDPTIADPVIVPMKAVRSGDQWHLVGQE